MTKQGMRMMSNPSPYLHLVRRRLTRCVAAIREIEVTDVVVDVEEDPHCEEARDDCDDADDYCLVSYDNEVLDVDEDGDDEECEEVTPRLLVKTGIGYRLYYRLIRSDMRRC